MAGESFEFVYRISVHISDWFGGIFEASMGWTCHREVQGFFYSKDFSKRLIHLQIQQIFVDVNIYIYI